MDQKKYRKLVSEVFSSMKGEKLTAALDYKRPSERVDAVQDLMRQAIIKSSIGYFNGSPYFFAGRIYEPMTWNDFGNLVYDLMHKCSLPNGDYSRIEGVIRVCRRSISGKVLRPNNSIVVMKNCVLDLETRKTHKFNKKFIQVTAVDFDYDPEQYPNAWCNFLDEVLDMDVQRVLQEFLGSVFIDRSKAKMEQMVILKGAGGNGKSVIFETVMGLLGRENVSNFGIGALLGGADRKKNIAFINGKRLNYCSEIQTAEFGRDSDALKALISGEPTEARPLYGDNFTAYNIPLLMANANKLPYLKDWSHGMRRRIIIIPFDRIIPESLQNKSLARELTKDYPGIFNWLLAGRERFIANGYKLTNLKVLDEAADEYQAESSTVLQYMKAKDYNRSVIETPIEPKWLQAQKLYHGYTKWCAENNIEGETLKKFGMVLNEAGYMKRKNHDCMVYAVYQHNERPVAEEYKKKNEAGQVQGMRNLAHWTGVSRQTIEKIVRAGALDGCYTKDGNYYYFNLSDSRAAIRKFLKSIKRSRMVGEVPEDVKADRRSFNKLMKEYGEPFRKYDAPDPNGIGLIYVTDEFNYQLDKNNWKDFVKFKNKE